MNNMKKTILEMPKCLDKNCINGIVTEKRNSEVVQKICARCEKIERDLEESDDYIVYYENGRAKGYELIIN